MTLPILRDYQDEAVHGIRAAFARGVRRVLFQGQTGMGKTVIFSYIAQSANLKGNNVMVLVHRRELLNQASRTFTDFDVPHGYIAAGKQSGEHEVYIASKDTLIRRTIPDIDLLVIDEAHHAVARTYQRIIAKSKYVLGVTATPCRMTGTGLGSVFDELIVGPQTRWLMNNGYLSDYKYFAPPVQMNLKRVKTTGGDYQRDMLAAEMDRATITGDAVGHYAKHLNGAPAIVFCVSVEHAHHCATMFSEAGFRAVAVDGGMDSVSRDAAIRDFAEGRINTLMSCDLVNEGLDVPGAYGAVMLRPTKSLVICMQQWGRCLRPYGGKTHAIFLDHVGNCNMHGLPDDIREWSLETGAVKPKRDDDAGISIRQCPKCYWVDASSKRQCTNCGFEFAVKTQDRRPSVVDGELVERVDTFTKEEKRDMIRQAKSYDDLLDVGKKLGYKPGWAWWMKEQRKKAASKYRSKVAK